MTRPASTDDLFAVCADLYSEPVARVASNTLYWSQFGKRTLGGRSGIYKTDAELAADLRKSPKTLGRLLRKVCKPDGEESPDSLFTMAHGPRRPGRAERVRWLFRTKRGDALIAKARERGEARHKKRRHVQNAVDDHHEKVPPVTAKCDDQSPHIAPTPLNQKDSSVSQPKILSKAAYEKETTGGSEKEDKYQEEVTRLQKCWKAACAEMGNPSLAWRNSEVRDHGPKLVELIEILSLAELSDEDLLKRLRLLAGDLEWLIGKMSAAFMKFNQHGLVFLSFVKYGRELWRAANDRLAEEGSVGLKKKPSLLDYGHP